MKSRFTKAEALAIERIERYIRLDDWKLALEDPSVRSAWVAICIDAGATRNGGLIPADEIPKPRKPAASARKKFR